MSIAKMLWLIVLRLSVMQSLLSLLNTWYVLLPFLQDISPYLTSYVASQTHVQARRTQQRGLQAIH